MNYRCGVCNGWCFLIQPDMKTADLCSKCGGTGRTDDPKEAFHPKVYCMGEDGKLFEFASSLS